MRRLILSCLVLPVAAWLASGSAAHAGCQVDTRPVAFGVVDVTRQNDTSGEVTLNCTIATEVEVALSSAQAPGQRSMAGPGGGQLTYELYPDATRTIPWGDGTGNSTTRIVTITSEGTMRLTIYGRVPKQNAVPPGAYGDALTVVVNF